MQTSVDGLLIAVFHGISWFDEEEEAVVRKALEDLHDRRVKPPVESGSINMKDPNEQKEKETLHTVTEEDLKANPELVDEGVAVGDAIGIPQGNGSLVD